MTASWVTRLQCLVVAGLALAVPGTAGAQTCPSANVNDVINDPGVQDALDQAWADSNEGSEDEHEEGGWIQQCRMENVITHEVRYYTQVLRWPHGTVDGSAPTYDPRQDSLCRTVATFHTHPGPALGHPESDGYQNEIESPEDLLTSANDGLPGIIRYGAGSDTHDFTYGYNRMEEPRDPGWTCPDDGATAHGYGDPHLQTLDGLAYDFMAIGDFVLFRSEQGDVELQGRLQPYGQARHAAITAGLAIRDGRDRVEWRLGEPQPALNGKPVALAAGTIVRLRSHGLLRADERGVAFVSSVGDRLGVTLSPDAIDYTFTAAAHRRGAAEGLFGNFDGDPDNDLRGTDGVIRPPGAREAQDYRAPIYVRVGARWRVTGGRSLFASPFAGAGNADIATFPQPSPETGAEARAAALAACSAAGVSDPVLIDACVFDRLSTGRESFVASAAAVDARLRAETAVVRSGTLAIDQEMNGRLDASAREVAFRVTTPAGLYLVDGRGSRATRWKLLSAAGDDLLASHTDIEEYPARLRLPAGTYQLQVTLAPDAPAGRVRVRFRSTPAVVTSALATATAVAGTIARPGEARSYGLSLTPGTYDFTPTSNGDLWWSLTDADGNEYFDANQRVYMERAQVAITTSGRYTLTVSGRDWIGIGTYRLEYRRLP